MSRLNRFRPASRLFALLVLLRALAFVAREPPAAEAAYDDALNALVACANTFDGRLNDCLSGDVNRCVTWTGNSQCAQDFGSCFADDINLYSNCLGDISAEMETCFNSHVASQKCNGSFDACEEAATTMEQLGNCMMTRYECHEKSGVDNCT